jgi:hypothetical protein
LWRTPRPAQVKSLLASLKLISELWRDQRIKLQVFQF